MLVTLAVWYGEFEVICVERKGRGAGSTPSQIRRFVWDVN